MKTGGTSVARLLIDHFGADRCFPRAGGDRVAVRMEKYAPRILLGLPAEERARFAAVSTHMAAWVAEEFPDLVHVAVLRDPVDRTVSHLRQLARLPFTGTDLEELYLDPMWHPRLVNLQTQIFAASRALYDEQVARMAGEHAPAGPRADEGPRRERMQAAFATSIGVPLVIDAESFAAAVERLDRFDEVGVTERLDEMVDRLGRRLDRPLPVLGRHNVARDEEPVPPGLRERIEQDNRWDRLLHERALARQVG
jgi:hypothetical protein